MNDLTETLKTLPANGRRLTTGLALRLTTGNGIAVLGCSRVDTPPTDEDMEAVQSAVWQVFTPTILLQGTQTERRLSGGYTHHIRRLYWPLEGVAVVGQQPVQATLWPTAIEKVT